MQTQFNAFSEQFKNLGAAYTETAKGNEKTRSKKSDE
jgi:hypothetical protein